MPFARIDPDDATAVGQLCDIRNAADAVDDPEAWVYRPDIEGPWLRWGHDLHPAEVYLYTPDGAGAPVGTLSAELPVHDNLHLMWFELVVHPDHRRQGYGTALLEYARELAARNGRSTMWVGSIDGNTAAQAFLNRAGFHRASGDARRRQRLAELDPAEIDRLEAVARSASDQYAVERLIAPSPPEVLTELIEVTAAINDAPMGTLTYEDEAFDLQRITDVETAAAHRGVRAYRVAARHRDTGEVGGHTQVTVDPRRPAHGSIGDTAVSRAHRGRKLGLRLKIDMLRWLAEVEPQLEVIETWNNVDNGFMISVNESLGYRLTGTFSMYELTRG